MYTLSALLKHNRTAVEALGGGAEGDGGWKWAGERVGDARGWGVVVAGLKGASSVLSSEFNLA
jgi:hypothetical protein